MYGTATNFINYHEARGRTIPVAWDTAFINATLLVASEWLDNVYGSLFFGYPTDGFEQVRQWPRTSAMTNTNPVYVFATDEIPDRIDYATYEAAWREGNSPESLNVDYTPSQYNSVAIEGAVTVDYNTSSDVIDLQTQIRIVDSLMTPLLDPSSDGYMSNLSGASERV